MMRGKEAGSCRTSCRRRKETNDDIESLMDDDDDYDVERMRRTKRRRSILLPGRPTPSAIPTGHYRSDCPELKNQNHENGGTRARRVVHALGGGETNQDHNDMEEDINA
ncbi:hypothetical protein Tco_0000206 [Tanacetum coccineum]